MSTKDDDINIFQEMVELNGVAITSVSDGFVLSFKRDYMKKLIDKHPDHEKLVIFIQKPGAPS